MAALLVATATLPASANAAAAAAAAQQTSEDPNRDIIITAPPLFRGIQPERNLNEDAIESYGVSTIDELLGEVEAELGEDEEPLIIVNGKRVNDLSEIGAFPVEALRSAQVLPRGSAVRAGGKIGQRVISLTLKRQVRSATLVAAHKVATDGHWNAERGEAILTSIKGPRRFNLSLRARDESSLLESERGIIQPVPSRPYAITGNVIGYPSVEIDPLLSALAGEIVSVAPVPTITNPSLADFAAHANQAAITDIGQFRTLRPKTRNYDLNGSFATRLAPWLTSITTVHLSRGRNRYERGLPAATFILSPTNPASPFSQNVGLAYYGKQPLIFRTRNDAGEANLTLDADWGAWTGNFNARHSESKNVSLSDRESQFGAIPLADTVNPFTTDLTGLIALRTDRATSRSITNLALLSVTGPAFKLPAGDVQATIEEQLSWDSLHSRSTFSSSGNSDVRRNQQSVRGALDVPLTSRQLNVLSAVGDLNASGEYVLVHYSDAGTLHNYAAGLSWEPRQVLHLQAEYRQTEMPPLLFTLANPTIITPDVRIFDPLTGQTVDVTEIFGGNSNLRPETDKVRRASAILRLVPRLNLQANAEYTDTNRRNFVSSLPQASAAVMLAFPERFVRDSSGVLTTVDLRPVNFDSDREKRLRWGISTNIRLSTGPLPGTVGTPPHKGPIRPPTMFQLTFNHTIVFSDKIVIRPGLPDVDLLKGGAIGIASGRVRHQLDVTTALTSGGLGVRAGVIWRGKNTLESRIGGVTDTLTFSPLLTLNLRAFADASRFLPDSKWAKGFRLSLDATNLANKRQRVRDSFGNTPLQYQPGYRDPLGRTIEIELRKVF